MADSSDKSQGKKENTSEGSCIDETTNNESAESQSIAVPASPNQPQVSIIGGSGAAGDEEAGLSGESGTKREDQELGSLVRGVDKGKAVITFTGEDEEERGLLYMEKLQLKKPDTNFDGSKVLIPCRVCGKRFSRKTFFNHLIVHPGWNPDGKFLPLATPALATLTNERVAELVQELPSTLFSIGWKILEQMSSSGEGPSMQYGNMSDNESKDGAFGPGF